MCTANPMLARRRMSSSKPHSVRPACVESRTNSASPMIDRVRRAHTVSRRASRVSRLNFAAEICRDQVLDFYESYKIDKFETRALDLGSYNFGQNNHTALSEAALCSRQHRPCNLILDSLSQKLRLLLPRKPLLGSTSQKTVMSSHHHHPAARPSSPCLTAPAPNLSSKRAISCSMASASRLSVWSAAAPLTLALACSAWSKYHSVMAYRGT